MQNAFMADLKRAARLREARRDAGYSDGEASAAARSMDVPVQTYLAHENGTRGFSKETADKYARKYGVSFEWLQTGRGAKKPSRAARGEQRMVPLVGYVGAGATAYFVAAGELGEVEAPDGATDSTVAVEIRGDSLGPLFDHWLVFYDDVRRPVTTDLIGRLCIVGLEDDRVLIKKIKKSKTKGLFHLISQSDDPILDVVIEWAAQVKIMVPR